MRDELYQKNQERAKKNDTIDNYSIFEGNDIRVSLANSENSGLRENYLSSL